MERGCREEGEKGSSEKSSREEGEKRSSEISHWRREEESESRRTSSSHHHHHQHCFSHHRHGKAASQPRSSYADVDGGAAEKMAAVFKDMA